MFVGVGLVVAVSLELELVRGIGEKSVLDVSYTGREYSVSESRSTHSSSVHDGGLGASDPGV